jgi:ATP-binding cassette subfamily B protein
MAIILTLLIIDPFVSLISIIGFSSIYLVVVLLTKKRTRNNGRIIAAKSTNLIRFLQEGLGGIRDVLLGGDQEKHCKNYNDTDLVLRRAEGDNLFLSQSPRFFIEAIGIVMIACIAYYLSLQHGGIYKVMPILGALALGAQRMLPAFQQIYFGWSNIQSGIASLEDVLELLAQPIPYIEEAEIKPLNFNNEISIKNISFSYSKNNEKILKDINFTIKKGDCIGVIGETGSGKSTLLDLIMGLLNPTNGNLLVDGVLITKKNIRSWQKNIAHIPQSIFLIDASIEKNIIFEYSDQKIDKKRIYDATRKAKMFEFINRKKDKFATVIGENGIQLSGGQRQRIGIARAIYKDSNIIIFDEATSALDSKTEDEIISLLDLDAAKKTVIMVAHRISSLKNCNKIIELKDGKIVNIDSYQAIYSRQNKTSKSKK